MGRQLDDEREIGCCRYEEGKEILGKKERNFVCERNEECGGEEDE